MMTAPRCHSPLLRRLRRQRQGAKGLIDSRYLSVVSAKPYRTNLRFLHARNASAKLVPRGTMAFGVAGSPGDFEGCSALAAEARAEGVAGYWNLPQETCRQEFLRMAARYAM